MTDRPTCRTCRHWTRELFEREGGRPPFRSVYGRCTEPSMPPAYSSQHDTCLHHQPAPTREESDR